MLTPIQLSPSPSHEDIVQPFSSIDETEKLDSNASVYIPVGSTLDPTTAGNAVSLPSKNPYSESKTRGNMTKRASVRNGRASTSIAQSARVRFNQAEIPLVEVSPNGASKHIRMSPKALAQRYGLLAREFRFLTPTKRNFPFISFRKLAILVNFESFKGIIGPSSMVLLKFTGGNGPRVQEAVEYIKEYNREMDEEHKENEMQQLAAIMAQTQANVQTENGLPASNGLVPDSSSSSSSSTVIHTTNTANNTPVRLSFQFICLEYALSIVCRELESQYERYSLHLSTILNSTQLTYLALNEATILMQLLQLKNELTQFEVDLRETIQALRDGSENMETLKELGLEVLQNQINQMNQNMNQINVNDMGKSGINGSASSSAPVSGVSTAVHSGVSTTAAVSTTSSMGFELEQEIPTGRMGAGDTHAKARYFSEVTVQSSSPVLTGSAGPASLTSPKGVFNMNSAAHQQQSRSESNLHLEWSEFEDLLDSSVRKIEELENETLSADKSISLVEKKIQIRLDMTRNAIMRVSLLVSIAAVAVGMGSFIAGIGGMNFKNYMEESPFFFFLAIGVCFILSGGAGWSMIRFSENRHVFVFHKEIDPDLLIGGLGKKNDALLEQNQNSNSTQNHGNSHANGKHGKDS